MVGSAKDIIRPTSYNYLVLSDEDEIYWLHSSDTLELRNTDHFPPNAQIIILNNEQSIVTTDGNGTQKGSFYSSNNYSAGFSVPILLKKFPSFQSSSNNYLTFCVISDYYNQAQVKYGASPTVGGSGITLCSSVLNPIEYSHTGDTDITTVFKVDLGDSYTIKRVAALCALKNSDNTTTARVRIGYSTDDTTYTDGTAATTTSSAYTQVFPEKFEDITARYIRVQIRIDNAAETVYLRLYWLPCWVAKS